MYRLADDSRRGLGVPRAAVGAGRRGGVRGHARAAARVPAARAHAHAHAARDT